MNAWEIFGITLAVALVVGLLIWAIVAAATAKPTPTPGGANNGGGNNNNINPVPASAACVPGLSVQYGGSSAASSQKTPQKITWNAAGVVGGSTVDWSVYQLPSGGGHPFVVQAGNTPASQGYLDLAPFALPAGSYIFNATTANCPTHLFDQVAFQVPSQVAH